MIRDHGVDYEKGKYDDRVKSGAITNKKLEVIFSTTYFFILIHFNSL